MLMKYKRLLMKMSFIIALALLWEIVAYSGHFPEALFPKIEMIIRRFIDLTLHDALILKALYSISIVLIAMVISLVFAFLVVAIGARFEYVRVNTELLNAIASPIPGIAILPVIILWLGISQSAMMVIMIHAMLWPLWTNIVLAVDRISIKYQRMMTAFKIPRIRRIRHIYFEGILPDIVAGLEIAWSRGWRALLSIEMIFGIVGKQSGLGWLIYERRMYMDTAGMFAGLIAIALCGILFESVLFRTKKLEAFIETNHSSRESK